MQNKAIKITAGVVVGLLSLSTTAFAGYKVIQNKEVRVLGITASPVSTATPEVIEQIEVIEEVTVINTNKATQTSIPTTIPQVQGMNNQQTTTGIPKSTSLSTPFGFDDDEDDEVEFEDNDENKKNEDEHEDAED